jgi:hypothetical protein
MLEIDLALPHAYAVEEIGDLPGAGEFGAPLIYFPPPKNRPEHEGLWLKVTAASGKKWIGVFKFGYSSPPAFSCVVDSLDPDRMCVIAKGAAYIVKAGEPEAWEQIPLVPVLDFRIIRDAGLLIFSDFTRLVAYGGSGLAWRSPRVCWDGLKIVSVYRGIIAGVGHDPTNPLTHESRFAVELKTGRSLLPPPLSTDGEPFW